MSLDITLGMNERINAWDLVDIGKSKAFKNIQIIKLNTWNVIVCKATEISSSFDCAKIYPLMSNGWPNWN